MSIDKQRAVAELGIPVEMYDELLGIFVQQTGTALEDLTRALAAANFTEIARLAHFVKGSAGNLRLDQMHLLAKDIEFGAKEHKDITLLADLSGKLVILFDEFKKEISKG